MHKINSSKSDSGLVARSRRAWRFLRLALLRARKGGMLKKRLVLAIRNTSTHFHHLHHHHHHQHRGAGAAIGYGYGERQLSFDDTPVIHVKMHRQASSLRFKMPNIPCINPPVLDDTYYNYYYSSSNNGDHNEEEAEVCEEMSSRPSSSESGDEGIDLKAEQFISNFYQQIKLQRQISYLQYHEMISRGAN